MLVLVKMGTGTQTLSGTNAYTGATTVNGGALWVDGSLAARSAVTVASGGALGGTGKVYGVTTIAAGGQLLPGPESGVGLLTLASNLTVAAGGVVQMALGSSSDGVSVGGKLMLGGTLNITDAGGFTNGTYTLFTCSGTISNSGMVVGTTPAGGYVYRIDTNMVGQVRLVVLTPFEAWQMQYFGSTSNTNANPSADPDGDTMSNWAEYLAGTSPSNTLSRLVITNTMMRGETSHILTWPGVSGHVYGVERSTNLSDGFIGVLSNLPWMDPVNTATDDFGGTPVFYRVKVSAGP
jgi:fibronectin-binding autotransporter adhesin